MIALFENCSMTGEGKRFPVKPLELSASCERIYQKILKEVTDKGYYGLQTKKEFYEIYYWYLGFEITISLVPAPQGNKTYLNMVVYGEKKRGQTRSLLKRLLDYYKNLLNNA